MNIEIRPFRPKHLPCIVGREYEQEVSRATRRDWAQEFAKGQGYTVIADGVPVGAGGICPCWAGVGEAWLFLSPWFEEHHKTSYKIIRQLFDLLLQHGTYHRVQCPILDAPKNKRLARHLGFKPEGRMERWGPDGKDYVMFAIVAYGDEKICHLPC